MTQIHQSSIVDPGAQLGEGVIVGPFCLIGPQAVIGDGTVLMSHVTVRGSTTIGARNRIFQGAAIGCEPQDLKYAGEDTRLVIGDDNTIRENCTISIGTTQDQGLTTVGSNNLLMANVHVAHDCRVGSHTIIANNCALAGHVVVEDYAIIGGQTGLHQFTRVGERAMVGGASGVLRDVPPYVICSSNPAQPHGVNLIGLRRAGFNPGLISLLRECYRVLYRANLLVPEALAEIDRLIAAAPAEWRREPGHLRDFVAASERGIIR